MSDTVSSLLQKLSSPQIDDLIFENQLREEGFEFYYSIDNHDIHKYCFPGNFDGTKFEIDEATGDTNYDLETDVVTAYDDFFQNLTDDSPLFFLNEYIPELRDMKFQLEERIRNGRLFNYAKEFNIYFDKKNKDNDEVIVEDFTLFISIATGFIQNGAQRFNSIMTSPYFIFRNEQFSSVKNGKFIREAFLRSHDIESETTEKIFDLFMLFSKKEKRFSKRTDSEAMSRIIKVNELLINENKKVLILFLSTSDASKKVSRRLKNLLPSVKGQSFNFHRSVEQIFLNRLLQDLDTDSTKERLYKLKELILYREKSAIVNGSSLSNLEKNVFENLKTLREKYVNTNLARKQQFIKIKELSELLNKAKTNMNLARLKKLYNNLQNLSSQYSDSNQNIEDIKIVETSFQMDQTFMAAFRNAIHLLNRGEPIIIPRGKDIISGTGQHLPVVFLHNGPNAKTTMDEIAEMYLDQSAQLKSPDSPQSLVKSLTELAESIFKSEFSTRSLDEKLVLCLYLLVLPDAKVSQKTNNGYVEEFLLDIYKTYSDQEKSDTDSDFLYVLSWVLRRNKKYQEALKFTMNGIEKYPDDARFYHSRFLINVCRTSDNPNEKETAIHLRNYLSDIRIALEKYPAILNLKSDLIRKNILATLLNSEIYASTLLMNIENSEGVTKTELFNRLNTKLLELKALMGESYEEYPEFLHTEAFLEIAESDHSDNAEFKKEKIKDAIVKLEKSINTARQLINYDIKRYRHLLESIKRKEYAK